MGLLARYDDPMSLPREDLRLKMHAEDLARVKLVAEMEGVGLGEWAETVLASVAAKRIHTATVMADRARRAGLAGNLIPDVK